jgi:membrane-associated protein
MDWAQLIDYAVHFDKYLDGLANALGPWMYVIVFAIIFCETGLVVTPFLPGDSLLFGVGAIIAHADSTLSLPLMLGLLALAAILGDGVNYYFGLRFGERAFRSDTSRLFNRKHLIRTQNFYEKYGGETIILARFVPIIRTFAPFVAGMGRMSYPRFALYNVLGASIWVSLFLLAGYWLGNVEWVKDNRKVIFLAIIVLSVLPAVFEFGRAWVKKQKPEPVSADAR